MTLALYGKTRRRRVGLLLGGLLAAVVAGIVGLFALTSGNATACACETAVSIQVHKYLPKNNVNNPWENQGSSAGNWKFTVYEDNGGTPGAVLIADLDDLTPSAGFPVQDILVKETNTDGAIFFGWFKPDGDGENSGNDKCNQVPADFTTGGKYSRAEYLAIPATAFGTPGNLTGLLHICAYDKPAPPPNHSIQVCKIVEQNNDGVNQGGDFEGWVLDKTADTTTGWSVTGVVEGGAAVCTTVDTIPSDHAFNVTEFGFRPANWVSDPVGEYPWYADNKGTTHSVNPTTVDYTGNVTVTFHNKSNPATKQVVIAKQFTRLNGYEPKDADYPVFTFDPAITPAPVCMKDTSKLPDMVSWTCTVPAAWDGTVNEGAVAGWERATGCPTIASFAGGPQVFAFCNRPFGTIEIIKTDNTHSTNLDRPADGDWDFSVNGPSFAATTWLTFGGGTRTINAVPLGSGYTAAETDGRYGQCSTVSNPTGQGYQTTNIAAGPADLATPGSKITFVFRNDDCGIVYGSGFLDIWKVRDVLGDGVMNGADTSVAWNVTLTGPEFPSGATFAVPATGLHFSGLKEGQYTITETTAAGWKTVGVRTNEVAALVVSASTQINLHHGETDTVTFYNQPLGQIPVHKEAFTSHNGEQVVPAPQDDDGWTITVKSATCGINQQKVTDNHGDVLFTDLPMCTDYVVSESEVNTDSPGFVPLTANQFTGVTPNGVTLAFNNIKRTYQPYFPETPVPTATPVPPTPTTPAQPTTPPTQPPPPPATSIAGEKTPGPGQPTPIVPSTGNTGNGGGTGANTIFIVGALFAVATAFGATALTQRRRR